MLTSEILAEQQKNIKYETKKMSKFKLYCLQCGLGVVGATISLWFLMLLYEFLSFEEMHPINAIITFFGGETLLLDFPEIRDIDMHGITPLMFSITTAVIIYVILAGIGAIATYKLVMKFDDRLAIFQEDQD